MEATNKSEQAEGGTPYSADTPITTASDDKLDRAVFSRRIAEAIMGWRDERSLVIGVLGEWGCGKTSILQMALEHLQDRAVDAVLVEDEAGGYVATVAQLPGVISEGNDPASAICNLKEAFRAAIETYKTEGMPIPWGDPPPKEPGATRSRVAVNV